MLGPEFYVGALLIGTVFISRHISVTIIISSMFKCSLRYSMRRSRIRVIFRRFVLLKSSPTTGPCSCQPRVRSANVFLTFTRKRDVLDFFKNKSEIIRPPVQDVALRSYAVHQLSSHLYTIVVFRGFSTFFLLVTDVVFCPSCEKRWLRKSNGLRCSCRDRLA